MVDEFPANSHRAKATKSEAVEPPKVQRVVTGEVVRRKKSVGRRIIETFFGSDDARGVAQYLAQDVIVPMTKDLVTDVVTQGIERMVYGESSGRSVSARNRGGGSAHTPYNRYSASPVRREESRRELSARSRSRHEFDELEYDSKAQAEEVLDILFDRVEKYGMTTVADFYECSGVQPRFTDENYGWTELGGASTVRVRGGGWVIKFPPTVELR